MGTYLVVPSIRASSDLHTPLKPICPAQEVTTKIRQVIRRCVVEAHNEQRVINNGEACGVGLVVLERGTEGGPDLAVFRRKHADCAASDL